MRAGAREPPKSHKASKPIFHAPIQLQDPLFHLQLVRKADLPAGMRSARTGMADGIVIEPTVELLPTFRQSANVQMIFSEHNAFDNNTVTTTFIKYGGYVNTPGLGRCNDRKAQKGRKQAPGTGTFTGGTCTGG